MTEQAYIKLKDVEIPVEFMGIFQSSVLIEPSPLIGGHTGGFVASPVVVVKVDGELRQYKVNQLLFKTISPSRSHMLESIHFEPVINIKTNDGLGDIENRLRNMAREYENGGY